METNAYKVTIIIPTFSNLPIPLPHNLDPLRLRLFSVSGGFTEFSSVGWWRGSSECVVVMFISVPNLDDVIKLQDVALWAKQEYKQDSIYFEFTPSYFALL